MPYSVQKIQLQNYRNFDVFEAAFGENISVIIGNNGVGKTNILEAISLLSPGRGLRSSNSEEICKYDSSYWSVSSNLLTSLGPAKFDINYSKETSKKTIEFNGSKITNSELSNFINIIWLTPQMESLFLGPSGDRRKFLDRMTFSAFSDHAKLINKYEHHQKERMKLLEQNSRNHEWINVIEKEMAELSIKITDNRLSTIVKLNNNSSINSSFPSAHIELCSNVTQFLESSDPLEAIAQKFEEERFHDIASKRTNSGPHRADFKTFYSTSKTPAQHCSTGEQKALLISIIISQQISNKEKPPILLLDEIFVHLDEHRRKALAEFLTGSKFQTLITSTEKEILPLLNPENVVRL